MYYNTCKFIFVPIRHNWEKWRLQSMYDTDHIDDATYYCSLTDTTLTFDNVKKTRLKSRGLKPPPQAAKVQPKHTTKDG